MRSYKQYCGIAKALDLVGERWTLLLIRELLPGGRRYTDLLAASTGLTTNLLAKRLKDLEANGLITRRRLPPPAASTVYELTDLGRELEPALLALGRFGAHFLGVPEDDMRTHPRWLGVSLMRRFHDADPTPFTAQLHLGEVPLHARFDGTRLWVRDGEHDAEATLSGPAILPALTGRGSLPESAVDGDVAVAQRLIAGLAPMT